MMRQVIAHFDEYQSKENAKHVLRAMKENAKQGFNNAEGGTDFDRSSRLRGGTGDTEGAHSSRGAGTGGDRPDPADRTGNLHDPQWPYDVADWYVDVQSRPSLLQLFDLWPARRDRLHRPNNPDGHPRRTGHRSLLCRAAAASAVADDPRLLLIPASIEGDEGR